MSKKNIIFGIRAVIEAVKNGKSFEKIYVRKSKNSDLQNELLILLRKRKIPYQFVPIQKLNRFTGKNHQGVVAFLSEIEYRQIEHIIPFLYEKGETPFIIILDGITDVRNFGAIARTAECAGAHAIVVPAKGSAQINADAFKTSAGALHKIPVCRSMNLEKDIEFLKNSGLEIIAATEKSEKDYYEIDFTKPFVLIMGAEDKGISTTFLKMSDRTAKIPITGSIDSLNVSAAAAILCYEAVRQRPRSSKK